MVGVGSTAFIFGGESDEGLSDASMRAGLAPRPPFFQLGIAGVTIPALSIKGEIGQQLGYINAFGLGLTNFTILVLLAFAFSLGLAIPVALLAAYRPNGVFDRLSMIVSVGGLSVANYVLALVLVLLFAVRLAVLPAIGFVPLSESVGGNLKSLVLPVTAVALPLFCMYARFLRSDLVDQMQGQDYIVTAQAKGIGPWQVLVRHALRNSSFGLITVVGLNLTTVIGVTVIIEQIFALPGLGQLMLQAINARDVAVVQACVLVFALVTVVANLLADLLYAVLDPRIRYGSR
jgi:peptide/nickel transport system permease protein